MRLQSRLGLTSLVQGQQRRRARSFGTGFSQAERASKRKAVKLERRSPKQACACLLTSLCERTIGRGFCRRALAHAIGAGTTEGARSFGVRLRASACKSSCSYLHCEWERLARASCAHEPHSKEKGIYRKREHSIAVCSHCSVRRNAANSTHTSKSTRSL